MSAYNHANDVFVQLLHWLKGRAHSVTTLQILKAPKEQDIQCLAFQRQVQLLLGESLRMKRLSLHYPDAMYYAHAKLPSNAPNLETLTL
jgi:hypothetical protein